MQYIKVTVKYPGAQAETSRYEVSSEQLRQLDTLTKDSLLTFLVEEGFMDELDADFAKSATISSDSGEEE